jgi:hypothetical protein
MNQRKAYWAIIAAAIVFLAVVIFPKPDVRDTSSPEKALLGHWSRTGINHLSGNGEEVRLHYYFSPDREIIVDEEGAAARAYEVLEVDPEKRRVLIKSEGDGQPKTIQFNDSYTVWWWQLTRDLKSPVRWSWEDARQRP